MKKSMDVLIWAFLLFLITPSGMALASWNAVPGDNTYAWKLSLEKALLLVLSPSDKLQSSTQVKLAERRFGEMEQVLDSQYAVEGLDNLNKQLAATSTNIQKINKETSRSEVTDQYIVSLKKMSASLDEQKVKAKTGEIAIVAQKSNVSGSAVKPTAKPTVKPTVKPGVVNNPVATVTPVIPGTPTTQISATPSPSSEQEEDAAEVIDAIEETQDRIDEAIEILQQNQQNGLIQGNGDNEGGGSGGGNIQQQQQLLQENKGELRKNKGEDDDGDDRNNSNKELLEKLEENKGKDKGKSDKED